jgi:hypothetical protein
LGVGGGHDRRGVRNEGVVRVVGGHEGGGGWGRFKRKHREMFDDGGDGFDDLEG